MLKRKSSYTHVYNSRKLPRLSSVRYANGKTRTGDRGLEVSALEILYELDRRIALIDAGRTPQNEIDATRIRGSCRGRSDYGHSRCGCDIRAGGPQMRPQLDLMLLEALSTGQVERFPAMACVSAGLPQAIPVELRRRALMCPQAQAANRVPNK